MLAPVAVAPLGLRLVPLSAGRARKLHFLHGLGWVRTDPAGTIVAKYVIHYTLETPA